MENTSVTQYDMSKGQTSIELAEKMIVKKQADYETAAKIWLSLREGEAEVESVLGLNKDKAYQAYKSAMAIYKQAMDMFSKAGDIIKQKMQDYALTRKELPAAEGVHLSTKWKAECEDLRKLLNAIVANKAPINLIRIDDKYLGAMAESLKDTLKVDGIKVWEEKVLCKNRTTKKGE